MDAPNTVDTRGRTGVSGKTVWACLLLLLLACCRAQTCEEAGSCVAGTETSGDGAMVMHTATDVYGVVGDTSKRVMRMSGTNTTTYCVRKPRVFEKLSGQLLDNRFDWHEVSGGDVDTFKATYVVDREENGELGKEVRKMEDDGSLIVFGLKGFGKSHSLLLLSQQLLDEGHNVFYLPHTTIEFDNAAVAAVDLLEHAKEGGFKGLSSSSIVGACLGLSVLQRSSDLKASLLYKLYDAEDISEEEYKLMTVVMEEVSRCLPEDVRKEQEMSKPLNWHENDILMFSGRMISAKSEKKDKEATEQLFDIIDSIFEANLFAIFDQMYGKESPFSWDDLKSDFLSSKKVFGMSYNAASRKEGRLEMLEYCAQCSYRQFAFTTEMSQDEIWTMMELEFGKQNEYLRKIKESSGLTEKMVFYAGHIPLYWIEIFEEYVAREGKDLDKAANAFWEGISPSDHFKKEYKRLNELSSTRGEDYVRTLSELTFKERDLGETSSEARLNVIIKLTASLFVVFMLLFFGNFLGDYELTIQTSWFQSARMWSLLLGMAELTYHLHLWVLEHVVPPDESDDLKWLMFISLEFIVLLVSVFVGKTLMKLVGKGLAEIVIRVLFVVLVVRMTWLLSCFFSRIFFDQPYYAFIKVTEEILRILQVEETPEMVESVWFGTKLLLMITVMCLAFVGLLYGPTSDIKVKTTWLSRSTILLVALFSMMYIYQNANYIVNFTIMESLETDLGNLDKSFALADIDFRFLLFDFDTFRVVNPRFATLHVKEVAYKFILETYKFTWVDIVTNTTEFLGGLVRTLLLALRRA